MASPSSGRDGRPLVGTAIAADSKQRLFCAQRTTEQSATLELLLNFLRPARYKEGTMAKILPKRLRPDVDAAERGGDWSQRMNGEGIPADSTIEQAAYWRQVYTE